MLLHPASAFTVMLPLFKSDAEWDQVLAGCIQSPSVASRLVCLGKLGPPQLKSLLYPCLSLRLKEPCL